MKKTMAAKVKGATDCAKGPGSPTQPVSPVQEAEAGQVQNEETKSLVVSAMSVIPELPDRTLLSPPNEVFILSFS